MRIFGFCLIAFLMAFSGAGADPPALATNVAASAEDVKKPLDIAKTEDFRPLFEERDTLINEVSALDVVIANLSRATTSLGSLAELEQSVATAQRNLDKANKAQPPDLVQIELFEKSLEGAKKDLATLTSSGPALEQKRATREAKGRRLFLLEQRIASLFDASKDINNFRSSVTYTFGVLVFVVIVGFYVIAQKTDIATTIFSGEMGMQFVTLFLIVIAIILFGIMGTLEGRELAALLGGLSGYILGRTSQPKARTDGGGGGLGNGDVRSAVA